MPGFHEGSHPGAESLSPQQKMEQERTETFPEVDAAFRTYKEAEATRQRFLTAVDQLPKARHDLAKELRDWATNLIPGVETTKRIADWARMSFGGSLKYAGAPYTPTSFEQLKGSIASWANAEKSAIEVGLGDLFHSTEEAMREAEQTLTEALGNLGPEEQLALFELQQKMFEEKG